MAKKPAGRKAAVSTQAMKLAEALTFVQSAAVKSGFDHPFETHVGLYQKFAYATNGILSAMHAIEEDLACVPHLAKLQAGIAKCGKTLTIAELDSGRLSVKGDNLRAVIPCISFDLLPFPAPDANIAPIDDRIKDAFASVMNLLNENATAVHETAVLLRSMTAVATDGRAMVEFFHGVDLPPDLVLPKSFMQAVSKQSKTLTGFGYSDSSVTFYYDDGSWIKTLRYADKYPDVDRILNAEALYEDAPEGLFEAIETVSKFNDKGFVTFGEGKVMSEPSDEIGAQFDIEGLQAGPQFDAALVKKIAPHAKQIDLTKGDRMLFSSPATPLARGVLMGVRYVAPGNEQRGTSELDEAIANGTGF